MEEHAKLHLGSCAWSFDDWRTAFYPEHLPPAERLSFYAQHFPTVEIDSTFYHAPSPQVAGHWLDVTPGNFVFSAKLPRQITHERKLRNCEALLDDFLASVTPLHPKLGSLLIQLPPFFTLKHDEAALRDFIRHLPQNFRFTVEFRDAGWHLPRIIHLLEEQRVCWAWTDVTPVERAGEAAFVPLPRTTDFIYVRLLGDLERKFAGNSSRLHQYRQISWPRNDGLENWKEKICTSLRDVSRAFVYVNNHFEGFAPHTIRRFAEKLGVLLPQPDDPAESDDQQMTLL